MTLELLQKEMVVAMKDRNKIRKQVISDIISTAKNIAISNKQKDNVTDEYIQTAILKVQKTVQEQIDTCPRDRQDLLNEYSECLLYVKEFAPKMMSEEEIAQEIDKVLATFDNKPNKGMVMKKIMPILKGKADGKLINKIVEEKIK